MKRSELTPHKKNLLGVGALALKVAHKSGVHSFVLQEAFGYARGIEFTLTILKKRHEGLTRENRIFNLSIFCFCNMILLD